jgi:hypothetical protein
MIQTTETQDAAPGNLPLPAVKLAYRLTQLIHQSGPAHLHTVQILVIEGVWYIVVNGRAERLGAEQ